MRPLQEVPDMTFLGLSLDAWYWIWFVALVACASIDLRQWRKGDRWQVTS